MTIFYSHGDKGGVGKSLVSAVLIDYLCGIGRTPKVIDGDFKGADIAKRYADTLDVSLVNLNMAGDAERAVIVFTDVIASNPGGDIVVNLPASAGATIEELAPVLLGVAEEAGHETRISYALGHSDLATKNFLETFESGLFGLVDPDRRCVVYPLFLGASNNFHFVASGVRDRYLDAGGFESAMPALKPNDFAMKVLSTTGRFSDLLDKNSSPLTPGERFMLDKKWLQPALNAVSVFVK
ncbi:P-loop NTPase family protein [Acidithiobacillus ferriphilus]|uniref:hypothetical protein n=1 Tax=Acidithiobacillus ferriphilus TaxID=1689834 RepID=UPI002DBC3342|nr:hypothetical protein [Acidithiobacillus ferriphilus]MEB8536827.1 hypothetical protein [Acidithiobacillus ferriphilus]